MMQLINGDCLEEMKQIPSGSVDLVLTDPPYGTTACKWDSVIPFDEMWERLNKLIKPNGAIVLFGSEPFSSALRMSNIKNYKYDWVWEKDKGTGAGICNKQPMRKTENISVFYERQPKYDSQGEKLSKPYRHVLPIPKNKESYNISNKNLDEKGQRIYKTYTHKKKTNLIYFSRDSIKRNHQKFHPTQKPVALMEYLIKTYTNENETVLDFTIGSGTTAVACINTNRNFIGIEKEQEYIDIANNRIKEALEQRTTVIMQNA